jgi:hypothetical protein
MQTLSSSCDLSKPSASAKIGLERCGTLSAGDREPLVTPLSRVTSRHPSQPCPIPLRFSSREFQNISSQNWEGWPRNEVPTGASARLTLSEDIPHVISWVIECTTRLTNPHPYRAAISVLCVGHCSIIIISLPPLFILSLLSGADVVLCIELSRKCPSFTTHMTVRRGNLRPSKRHPVNGKEQLPQSQKLMCRNWMI